MRSGEPVRLFLDTNVIISGMLFPNGRVAEFLREAIENHTIVLGDYVVAELREVFSRKFPQRLVDLEEFLTEFSYELVGSSARGAMSDRPIVRDPKDIPILDSAAQSDCDYLITGDKDLTDLSGLERPIIMGPSQFLSMVSPVKEPHEPT